MFFVVCCCLLVVVCCWLLFFDYCLLGGVCGLSILVCFCDLLSVAC